MLRGYRCIVIAACGLALVGAAPIDGGNGQSNQTAAKSASGRQMDRLTAALEKLPQSEAKDAGCEAGQEKRDSDLCAQWKSADAASESAWWTAATFFASLIGIGLGAGTLFAAWSAAHWAKQAAAETKRSADFARDSYVAFTDLERARVFADTSRALFNPHSIAAVEISLKNVGKSSAALLSAQCDFMEGCAYPEKFQRDMRLDRVLESQGDTTFLIHSFDGDATFKTHPFVGGYVEYRSSFGKTHRAHFLGRIENMATHTGDYIGTDYHVRSDALYCSREEREGRFGWPADD
jgi:hypothetical protein